MSDLALCRTCNFDSKRQTTPSQQGCSAVQFSWCTGVAADARSHDKVFRACADNAVEASRR